MSCKLEMADSAILLPELDVVNSTEAPSVPPSRRSPDFDLEELYPVVAEVLVWVNRMNRKRGKDLAT